MVIKKADGSKYDVDGTLYDSVDIDMVYTLSSYISPFIILRFLAYHRRKLLAQPKSVFVFII